MLTAEVHGPPQWRDLQLDEHQAHLLDRARAASVSVRGISQRMLTLRLKKLEENGLVKRTIFATAPPRVDYELTPLGRTLIGPVKALLRWVTDNRAAMAETRRAYAKAPKRTA